MVSRPISCSGDPSPDRFDWSGTPLGAADGWSAGLRAAVEEALSAPVSKGRGHAGGDGADGDHADAGEGDAPSPAAILDALFSAAPLGMGIWDRDLRFIRVNASMAAMNGLSPAAHVGQLPTELLPDIAGLDAVMDRWRRILDTGEPWLDVEVHGRTLSAPDVDRVWREQFFPIHAGSSIVGIGAVVEEVTERRRVEEALRASEARFREFAGASSDIMWIRNTATNDFEFLSAGIGKLYSGSMSMPTGEAHRFDWQEAVIPEDRAAAAAAFLKVRQGQSIVHDHRARIPGSGKIRWLRNTAFPLHDADGTIRRIGGIVRDVTDEREGRQRLNVLIGELQHRTRNLMGVVQAMMETTLAASSGLDAFAVTFGARLATLSRVQNLLSRLEGLERICFSELLACEFGAVGALPRDDRRVSLEGPEQVPLRSGGIQTLALAIHELITNSLKYGALAQPGGRLRVQWWLSPEEPGHRALLHIDWRETGVAMAVGAADRSGQGRELIEQALPYQLHARTSFALTPDGVHCVIILPVSHTADRRMAG